VVGVADVVHEAQGRAREEAIPRVVLDEDATAGHPRRLTEQDRGVVGVVQDVDQQHDINRPIALGDRPAVEGSDRDVRVLADQDIDPANPGVGPEFLDPAGQETIAAADVQYGRVPADQAAEELTEPPDPTPMDMGGVEPRGQFHFSGVLDVPGRRRRRGR
jgi:hypothetical protein